MKLSAVKSALAAIVVAAVVSTVAQSKSVAGEASPFIATDNEPAPELFVDPPLPVPLARGAVLIQYRTANIHIVPVFGPPALGISPRVGHLHVTVDDLPWHWADASNTNTVVIVGMPPGEHKVLIELADATHHILLGKTLTFTVPVTTASAH